MMKITKCHKKKYVEVKMNVSCRRSTKCASEDQNEESVNGKHEIKKNLSKQ